MTVHLLPGLGATSALYAGYELPCQTRASDYLPPPHAQCSFADYARFMIRELGIQPGDSLIGVSLGGMMACEISKWMPISKITLVSSCRQRQQLNPLLSHLSFLGPRLPWALLQRLSYPMPGLNESQKLAVTMFREADPAFVYWGCSHAAHWEGLDHHPDILSIHGDRDLVFPLRRQTVQQVIPGGGHLMIVTHRCEILPLLAHRHG